MSEGDLFAFSQDQAVGGIELLRPGPVKEYAVLDDHVIRDVVFRVDESGAFRRLFWSHIVPAVTAIKGVINALSNDHQISGSPIAQKLFQAMVVNLPTYDDESILSYGMALLDHPEHLTALEILEVVEPVEKAHLAHQNYDGAIQLMERAEIYAIDERTKAEF